MKTISILTTAADASFTIPVYTIVVTGTASAVMKRLLMQIQRPLMSSLLLLPVLQLLWQVPLEVVVLEMTVKVTYGSV